MRLFVSPEILEEYESVLGRTTLNLRPQKVGILLHQIQKVATVVKPTKRFTVAPDESDNRFLECAERARAEYLVTGNKKDFPFPAFRGVKIVSPREFVSALFP